LYMLVMLPLGVVYFTINVTLLSLSLSMIAAPLALFPGLHLNVWMFGIDFPQQAPYLLPLVSAIGVLLLFASLHLFRAIGRMHGSMAKHLLVKTAQYS